MLNNIIKVKDKIYYYLLNLSIFNKIFYGTTLIAIFVIVFSSFISYSYSRIYAEEKVTKNAAILVKNINMSFEENLEQLERIIMLIYSDISESIADNMSLKSIISTKTYSNQKEQYRALQITNNFFYQIVTLRNDISNIYLYISMDKNYSYTSRGKNLLSYNPTEEKWYQDTLKADGKTIILPPHKPYHLNDNTEVISFSKLIKNIDNITGKPYGILLIDLSLQVLDNIIENGTLDKNNAILFLDNNNNIIYSKNTIIKNTDLGDIFIDHLIDESNEIFLAKISNINYLVAYSHSKVTGWKLITLTPYKKVTKESQKLLYSYLILIVIAVLVSALLAYFFSRLLYKPIKAINNGISKVEKGDLDYQIKYIPKDELGQLVNGFNSMIVTTKKMIFERYEEKLARNEAEIKYLQAQINPHFIYNILQIISSISVVKKVPEINIIAKNLGKLLRYRINTNNSKLSVLDEISNAVSYMDIQKMRFKDVFNYETDINKEVNKYSILKLVLQPIVENSIIHGLEKKDNPGIVKISINLVSEQLLIEVWDNGIGMSKNEIDILLANINSVEKTEEKTDSKNFHNNVGLKNINRRIQLIYGTEYGLRIDSKEGEWTKVGFTIPAVIFSKEAN